jgi:hypothetical protein
MGSQFEINSKIITITKKHNYEKSILRDDVSNDVGSNFMWWWL